MNEKAWKHLMKKINRKLYSTYLYLDFVNYFPKVLIDFKTVTDCK